MPQDTRIDTGSSHAGPEPFAMCMACGTEHGTEAEPCPKCGMTLAVVRRCPGCARIVSAKHEKCVYCSTRFVPEAPPSEKLAGDSATRRGLAGNKRWRRAAFVSVATFLVVFGLMLTVTRNLERQEITGQVSLMATSYLLRSAELKGAASANSSNIEKLAPTTVVRITGVQAGPGGERWMRIDWHGATAYLRARDLAPPRAATADGGFTALKFYLPAADTPAVLGELVAAVNHYATAFPADPGVDELRWLLAEHLLQVAPHAASPHELLRQARQQLEKLSTSNNSFQERARERLATLDNVKNKAEATPRAQSRDNDLRMQETRLPAVSSGMADVGRSPVHEMVLLGSADVAVRIGSLGPVQPGSTVRGQVARPVRTNGILAIPADSPCELRVTAINQANTAATVTLATITVENRTYAVNSTEVRIPTSDPRRASSTLVFHLTNPLTIAH